MSQVLVVLRNGYAQYFPRHFRRRPRFSPMAKIFANGRDFRQRPRFSPAAEIFADGREFRRRLRFLFVIKSNVNRNENENGNETGEDTYAGALRAPRAGSPAFVSVFVFVLIYVEFEFQKNRCREVA